MIMTNFSYSWIKTILLFCRQEIFLYQMRNLIIFFSIAVIGFFPPCFFMKTVLISIGLPRYEQLLKYTVYLLLVKKLLCLHLEKEVWLDVLKLLELTLGNDGPVWWHFSRTILCFLKEIENILGSLFLKKYFKNNFLNFISTTKKWI